MVAFQCPCGIAGRVNWLRACWLGVSVVLAHPAAAEVPHSERFPASTGRPTLLRELAQAPPPGVPRSGDDQANSLRDQIRQAIRLYQAGRCIDAIPVAKAAADGIRDSLGASHRDLVAASNIQALCHKALGQYEDAETLYREAIGLAEKAYGVEATEVAIMIDNLAGLYFEQQRIALSEPLRRRALEIFLKTTGPESANTLTSTQNLGAVLYAKGQHVEAERLYRRAMAIAEKVYRPNDPQRGRLLDNLAGAVRSQGRLAEAGPLYERAIAIFETSLGPEHPDTALALQNHAILLSELGDYAACDAQIMRALDIHTRNFGPSRPVLVVALNTLSNSFIDQNRWADAVGTLRRAANILSERRGMASDEGRGNARAEQQRYAVTYRKLVQALLHAAPTDPTALDEAFRMSQIALGSEASIAVSQMSARFAASDPQIGRVLRERQDLVGEADMLDQQSIAAAGYPKERRNPEMEQAGRDRMARIRSRVREIDTVLLHDFPGYAALADPQPLGITQTQQILRSGESLVVALDIPQFGRAPDESFVIVITNKAARWASVPLGAHALSKAVHALRCGLDATHWELPDCQILLGVASRTGALPFDLARAHAFYKALFGAVEDLIDGRHLLIVAAGSLSKLPPHVLVTEPPNDSVLAGERYRSVAWLTRRNAITILPSVASLQGLRSHAKTSRAQSPMIGFGNPLLTGPDGSDRKAWSKATCADATPIGAKSPPQLLAQAPIAGSLFRGAIANVDAIRRQVPMPETADELCAVARSVGASESTIRLGAQATEKAVKDLSRSGDLAQHAIVHFATHGLVEGDLPNLAEPALMLTPPDRANEEDDGLLTASEITQRKLDADWVIMSACNTAAGGAANADALSGLARSFFYAGARSLLVSHWAVGSSATVKIITTTVAAMKADPKLGRAAALRYAMLAMIDSGEPGAAHPSAWAPFVLVGEGAPSLALATDAIEQPKAEAQGTPSIVQKPKSVSKRASWPRAAPKAVPNDWQSRRVPKLRSRVLQRDDNAGSRPAAVSGLLVNVGPDCPRLSPGSQTFRYSKEKGPHQGGERCFAGPRWALLVHDVEVVRYR